VFPIDARTPRHAKGNTCGARISHLFQQSQLSKRRRRGRNKNVGKKQARPYIRGAAVWGPAHRQATGHPPAAYPHAWRSTSLSCPLASPGVTLKCGMADRDVCRAPVDRRAMKLQCARWSSSPSAGRPETSLGGMAPPRAQRKERIEGTPRETEYDRCPHYSCLPIPRACAIYAWSVVLLRSAAH
jgi:hypothetical protein